MGSADEELSQEVQRAEAAVASANAVSKRMSSAPHSSELLSKFEPLVERAREALSDARQTFSRHPSTPMVDDRTILKADLAAKLVATRNRLQVVQARHKSCGSPAGSPAEMVESAASTVVAAETIQYLAEADDADKALLMDYDDTVTAALDTVDRAARSLGRFALRKSRTLASLEVHVMGVQTKLKTFGSAPVSGPLKSALGSIESKLSKARKIWNDMEDGSGTTAVLYTFCAAVLAAEATMKHIAPKLKEAVRFSKQVCGQLWPVLGVRSLTSCSTAFTRPCHEERQG